MSNYNGEIEISKEDSPGRKIKFDKRTLKAFYKPDDAEKMYNRMRDIALYAEDDKDAISAIDKIWDRIYGRPKQSMDIESNVSMDAGIFIGGFEEQDASEDE